MSSFTWREHQFIIETSLKGDCGTVSIDGVSLEVTELCQDAAELSFRLAGRYYRYLVSADRREAWVSSPAGTYQLRRSAHPAGSTAQDTSHSMVSRMPGRVLRLAVETGSAVEKGQLLLVLEAMKMEHEITAPSDGRVLSFLRQAGEPVMPGDMLVEFEAAAG